MLAKSHKLWYYLGAIFNKYRLVGGKPIKAVIAIWTTRENKIKGGVFRGKRSCKKD